jgi:hypothetical protein
MLLRVVTKWQLWVVVAVLLIPVAAARADLIHGTTYSYKSSVSTGNDQYTDPSFTKLTDGVSDWGAGYLGGATNVGWNYPSDSGPDVVFDLHGKHVVNWVQVAYDVYDTAGIGGFDSVTVKLSNNADMSNPLWNLTRSVGDGSLTQGDSWYQGTTYESGANTCYGGNFYMYDTPAARYVEVIATPHSYGTAGGWGMINEVSILGTAAPIPEPSACVLLGVGLTGLLAYAWRKRR